MPPNNSNLWRGYEAYFVYRGTLTASQVESIDPTADFGYHSAGVQVENFGSVDIYVTLDGATNPTPDGTSDTGRKMLKVPRSQSRTFHVAAPQVRLCSSGTPEYQVLVLN